MVTTSSPCRERSQPFAQGTVAPKRRGQNATKSAISSLGPRTLINTLLNINAFVLVARVRSFTAAARELGIAPSAVTKRITQLEAQMGAALLTRSTRGLALTAAGERHLPRFLRLAGELEAIFSDSKGGGGRIDGHLRIKSPTTVTSLYLGALLSEFQASHPSVCLELVILDRTVNPLEEGFDLVIGARPASYPHVADVPLCHYPIVLVAEPAYLNRRGVPDHPSELVEHDCLTSALFGTTWQFEGPAGSLSVEIRSRFHANDGRVVLEGVRRGLGLAMLPRYLVDEPLRTGELVRALEGFRPVSFWLKALVPRMKMSKPAVRELVGFLKARMQPAPWDAAPARAGDALGGEALGTPSRGARCCS